VGCTVDCDRVGRECVGKVVGIWAVRVPMGMWGMTVICCWDMVSQSTNGMCGMTVICCWDVLSQSTNGDEGGVGNKLLERDQSEYQWECAG